MCSLRTVTTAALLFGAGILSAGPAPRTVSFLDPGTTVRSNNITLAAEATAALNSPAQAITLSGVPLVTGQTADFVVEPAHGIVGTPTYYTMKADGTSQPLNLAPRRAWRGTDPMNPGRSAFITTDEQGRLRTLVLDTPGSPATAITPGNDGSYNVSESQVTSAPLCSAIQPPQENPAPSGIVTPRDEEPTRPFVEVPLRIDISHALYISLGKSEERVADYITDIFGAASLIFRRDVRLHLEVTDVVIWTERPSFELPVNDYYEEYGTSPSALRQAAISMLEDYGSHISALPAAAKRGAHFFLFPHPYMASQVYLGRLGRGTGMYNSGLIIVSEYTAPTADPDHYVYDTWNVCHSLGHMMDADHTNCFTPPIDCCLAACACSTVVPQAGTIMSYCNQHPDNGGSIEMRFHQRVIEEALDVYLDTYVGGPTYFASYTAAPVMAVHGFKDTYISSDSEETTAATLRATPDSGPVQQEFVIRNLGSAPLILTATPPVATFGSDRLTIVSQPDKTILEEGESTSFIMSYDPANGPAYGQVSIPTNLDATPDYTFRVSGQVFVPSQPVVSTYAPGLAIPDGTVTFAVRQMEVTDVPGLITDVKVRFDGTDCSDPTNTGIQHNNVSHIAFALESPEGTMIYLMANPGLHSPGGPAGSNFCNTILADDASAPSIQDITTADAPYTGTYRPRDPLSSFIGEYPNGHWRIYTCDTITGTVGTLHSISLIITGEEQASVDDWSIY